MNDTIDDWTHQRMRVASAEFFEHVLDLVFGSHRFEIFRLQIVFFHAFNAESKISGARYGLSPNLREGKFFYFKHSACVA